MSNKSFANLYRPAVFEDVVGQERIVRILRNSIRMKKIYGSYLFEGPYGTGKTTLARIFGRSLLCSNRVGENPCRGCASCDSFAAQNNPNYRELDAATNSGIDSIRKLQEFARMEAWGSQYKVIVIDECHDLSSAAQDALLKTIEETREGLVFLFCTTAGASMLDTVRSRSIVCSLEPPSIEDIQERLVFICGKEKINHEVLALRLIVAQNDSHLRDAIKELEVISGCYPEITRSSVMDYYGMQDFEQVVGFLKSISNHLLKAMDAAYSISTKSSVDHFLRLLQTVLADIFRIKFRHYSDLRLLDPKRDIDAVNAITSCLGRRIFLLAQYVIEMRRVRPDLDSLHAMVLYMSCIASQDIVFRATATETAANLKVDESVRSRESIVQLLEDPEALYVHGRKQRIKPAEEETPKQAVRSTILEEGDFIENLFKDVPSTPESAPVTEGVAERADGGSSNGSSAGSAVESKGSPGAGHQEIADEVGGIFDE